MEYETNNMPMENRDKKRRLLKAKIAVALQDEFGKVPTEEEIEARFSLNPGDVEGCIRPSLQA